MESESFAKGTEKLVDPLTVGSIHFLQQLYGTLPLAAQRFVLERASRKTPHMGFVVEPYAFFLFYELRDEYAAAALLPNGFRLAKARVFEGDEPRHYMIMSFFRVHTSAFWGARAECYLIAEDERTGLLSWIIVDYLSDTISYDTSHGLRGPSASGAVVATLADGSVLVDMAGKHGSSVAFSASLKDADMRSLDRRLWVEGNLSVGYGASLGAGDAGTFSLTFPPEEMAEALDVPLDNLRMDGNSWYADLRAARPSRLACFPYAQHLLSDSPGHASGFASEHELAEAVRAVDFGSMGRFSVGSVRTGMAVGTAATAVAMAALAWAAFRRRR